MKKFILEQLSGLFGLVGVVAIACESSSYGGQIFNGILGLCLMGLACVCWKIAQRKEKTK